MYNLRRFYRCLACLLVFSAVPGTSTAQPVVTVIDTGIAGVFISTGIINFAGGFNYFNNNTDIGDRTGLQHGTVSSRIINQEAPGIPQFIAKVTDGGFSRSGAATNNALVAAANNPDVGVIAMSDGVISVPLPGVQQAVDAGKLVVIRAGNGGKPNPEPGAIAAHVIPGVIIVTATNGGGGFIPGVNACGITAAVCVGATGTTGFSQAFGTSFATARLAGIAAAVQREEPHLDNVELAEVILLTAVDTGDPRLGHGWVPSAAHVLSTPAGTTFVADDSGGGAGTVLAAGALIGAAAGVGAVLSKNDDKIENTLIYDSYERDFVVDLNDYLEIDNESRSISRFFDKLDQRYDNARLAIDGNHTLDVAYITSDRNTLDSSKYFALDYDRTYADEKLNFVFHLQGEFASGFNYSVGGNHDPSINFGLLDDVGGWYNNGASSFVSGQTFALPLLGFADSADSVTLGMQGNNGFSINFGLVNSKEEGHYGRDSVAAVVEGTYRFSDKAAVSVQLGSLEEDGSLFGGSSNGAFSVDTTDTLATSLSAIWEFANDTYLIGNYGIAYSDVSQAETGLFKNFSSLRSDWFGVGVISNNIFSRGDQIGLGFSQPLRISSGSVDLYVPTGLNSDETEIVSNTDRISLEAPGREYTLESYYLKPLTQRSSLGAYLMLRHEPNHVEDKELDVTILGSYRLKF